jgi:O-acetylhomoserine (thiol)-lyase
VETLPLRMERHVANARTIAQFLATHAFVESVGLPRPAVPPDHVLAQRLMPRGCGAVFSFSIKGTRAQGRKLIESLDLFSHLANVGDAKSLVIHPASTTHFPHVGRRSPAIGHHRGHHPPVDRPRGPGGLIEDLSRALYVAARV